MAKVLVQKTIGGLKPIDEHGDSVFHKWALGDIIEVQVTKPRNGKLHAKFFALLNLAFQYQDTWGDMEDFREAVTIAAGFHRQVLLTDGTWQIRARSIKWSEIDDLAFSELYNRSIDVILKLLPGTTPAEIETELARF